MSADSSTPRPRPVLVPSRLLLPIGSQVTVDGSRFTISRTTGGRIVLFARDGSRAWLGEEDVAILYGAGRLRVTGRVPSRDVHSRRRSRR